jgi:arsenate reductase (thioredoxin)
VLLNGDGMMKKKVLFVCIHNSARSQMAEAWLNHLCGENFAAESAGLEPGKLNPLAVAVMREVGIDISDKKTRAISDVLKSGQSFSYVVTVCDETNAERCPIFPGVTTRLHWGFPDPAAVTGTDEERLVKVRAIRDAIRAKIEAWCTESTGVSCQQTELKEGNG